MKISGIWERISEIARKIKESRKLKEQRSRKLKEQRKGKEIIKTNFQLERHMKEEQERTLRGGTISGKREKNYNNAFGFNKKVKGAEYIGSLTDYRGTTHWHADRRKTNETIKGRKQNK